uniref:Uncharacterized protein n=1 Tax=Kalanchoe fedtschenkoi TaxID=63787 RepID=A0A7N0T2G8_KALFE
MPGHIHPLTLITLVLAVSSARELRPSEHGLGSQSDPPSATTEMKSFFASAAPPDPPALPNPADWWKRTEPASQGSGERGAAKEVLLVASLVCGIAGAALLGTAALMYAFRARINASARTPSSQLAAK